MAFGLLVALGGIPIFDVDLVYDAIGSQEPWHPSCLHLVAGMACAQLRSACTKNLASRSPLLRSQVENKRRAFRHALRAIACLALLVILCGADTLIAHILWRGCASDCIH